jgi:hypothetical protein
MRINGNLPRNNNGYYNWNNSRSGRTSRINGNLPRNNNGDYNWNNSRSGRTSRINVNLPRNNNGDYNWNNSRSGRTTRINGNLARMFIVSKDNTNCAVCLDPFHLSEQARQLECGHIYHRRCIFPWLERRHTCQICRFEMPY